MSELSDEVLEHAISYPNDLSPGNLIGLLKELKERRALAVLGEATSIEAAAIMLLRKVLPFVYAFIVENPENLEPVELHKYAERFLQRWDDLQLAKARGAKTEVVSS